MPRFQADVCIIGGGISAAMLAQKLAELRPGVSMIVVDAGNRMFDAENRFAYRDRAERYGENPWPGDFVPEMEAGGIVSRTMAVGGSALHWGGVTNRFSAEDLRLKSLYGLAVDWPIEWPELERYYCEAERRIGVAGEPSPFPEDAMSQPFPMPPMPLSYNLKVLKGWAEQSGIAFSGTPQAKNTVPYDGRQKCIRCNTCAICPTGARYSPDYTFKRLLAGNQLTLHDRTVVRRLVTHDRSQSIVSAKAFHRDRPDEPVDYEAGVFVVAAGYAWSPHLLLLSSSSRFPEGLANRSGLVGRYMNGHAFVQGFVDLDLKLYPGMNEQHSLISRRYFRCAPEAPLFVRHDLRVWESSVGKEARLRGEDGSVLLGDAVLADWRRRSSRATARVRAYYDVHPDRDSRLSLESGRRTPWGDPLPTIAHRADAASRGRVDATHAHVKGVFERMAGHADGRLFGLEVGTYLDHPAGGCRMGTDPATSVCDSYGRTHDHENLFVVGAPTLPTGGCTNGTLTFVALTLRSAERIAEQTRPAASPARDAGVAR
jgi:quinoprotein glucose dehydrogenase